MRAYYIACYTSLLQAYYRITTKLLHRTIAKIHTHTHTGQWRSFLEVTTTRFDSLFCDSADTLLRIPKFRIFYLVGIPKFRIQKIGILIFRILNFGIFF